MINALYALLFSLSSPLATHLSIEGFIGPDVSAQVSAIDAATSKDIYIYINSPGGMVVTGGYIIDAIERAKSRGQTVHCYAKLAASMAFFAYTHCSDRLAPADGQLLWHRVAFVTAQPLHEDELLQMYNTSKVLDALLLGYTEQTLKKSHQFVLDHALKQTMWNASDLAKECPGFLTIQELTP